MALLVVKIGQNEPDTYSKINAINKHLDIVDCPVNESKDTRGMGTMGDKEFLGIRFSWTTGISDDTKMLIKNEMKRMWCSLLTDTVPLTELQKSNLDDLAAQQGLPKQWRIIHKRLYNLDLSSFPAMTVAKKTRIEELKDFRHQKIPYDMKLEGFNDFSIIVPWNTLKNYIKNKYNGKTIVQELGL